MRPIRLKLLAIAELIACIAAGLAFLRFMVRDMDDPFGVSGLSLAVLSSWRYDLGFFLYGWTAMQGILVLIERVRNHALQHWGIGRWTLITIWFGLLLAWLEHLVFIWAPWRHRDKESSLPFGDEGPLTFGQTMGEAFNFLHYSEFQAPIFLLAAILASVLGRWDLKGTRYDFRELCGRILLVTLVLWWISGIAIRYAGPSIYSE